MFDVLKISSVCMSRFRRAFSISLACSIVVLETGCAVAPGMEIPSAMKHESESLSSAQRANDASVPITEIDAKVVALQASRTEADIQRVAVDLAGPVTAYKIGPADVLQVIVWDHPELAAAQGSQPTAAPRPADPPQGVVVDEDGYIQFPYVGRLKVSGLSTGEIQTRLRAALAEYFRSPQVTVRIASFRARRVFVDGEVHAPGTQQLNDVPMTLIEAIGRAGGFTPNADKARLVLARGGRTYAVDIPALLAHGEDPASLMLRSGDVLRVMSREESGAYVMGEVVKPTTAIPKPDGVLTLADALSQAGSLNAATSNPRQLYVVRGAKGAQPEVFHLDARSPVAMVMAGRFKLQPDDVVYVDATDLVRVNRVLTLLLPAINAALTGAVVTK